MTKTSHLASAVIICLSLFLAVTTSALGDIYDSSETAKPESPLDKIVFKKLAALDIEPTLCSDEVFLRRAYIDIIGAIPTAEQAQAFLDDKSADKRNKLIDRLLAHPRFADYWSMKWGDILRIKAEFPVNLWPNAAQAYHHWVRESIMENKPYDKFVREMLTASGSNFRDPPVNFYRAVQNKTPETITSTVALTLMGSRTDHWPEGRLAETSVFFSQVGYKPTSEWKEENVFWDPLGISTAAGNSAPGRKEPGTLVEDTNELPKTDGKKLTAMFPDGTKIELPGDRDPREIFADWLITKENPWFKRAIVNRIWAWIMGRGIIVEPDDIRNDNPPVNPELLEYLEKEFVDHNYDMKYLYRLILTSKTYQLASTTKYDDNPDATANFASYPLRRLEAEVLIDAVNKITETTDLYTSPIPEPFTYIPRDMPAVALADGSITSQFLTLFGRSARATGMADERSNNPVPSQWLHMLNSSHIQRKIEQGPMVRKILASGMKPEEIVEELYLKILSRRPTEDELKKISKFVDDNPSKRNAAIDITWALMNTMEFLYRH